MARRVLVSDALQEHARSPREWPGRLLIRHYPVALLVIIMLLAAFLRAFHFDSTPGGLFYDEGHNGMDALDVRYGHQLPLYFENNNGREPFFIYLQALSVATFGPSAFALRVVSLICGLLTVLALYLLGRELWGRTAGLLAALGLAISFEHVLFSRVALRTVSFVLIGTVVFWLLARAWRSGHTWQFAIAGALLGLAQYSYSAARLLPLAALAALIPCALANRRDRRALLSSVGAFVVAALVVSLPLLYYASHNSTIFWERTNEVSVVANGAPFLGAQQLAANGVRSLEALLVRGDPEWRHNLPARPLLEYLYAAFLPLGAILCLRRGRRATGLPLLAWLVVALLPPALTGSGNNAIRGLGALPPALVIASLGLATAARWAWPAAATTIAGWRRVPLLVSDRARATRNRTPRVLALGLLCAFLPASAALTYVDYFHRWASRQEVYDRFDPWATEQAAFILNDHLHQRFYLPSLVYAFPSTSFLLTRRFPERTFAVPPAAGRDAALALLPADRRYLSADFALLDARTGVAHFLPATATRTAEIDALYAAPASRVSDRFGRPLFYAVELEHEPFAPGREAVHPYAAVVNGEVELVGYRVMGEAWQSATAHPGNVAWINLYWRARSPIRRRYEVAVHLVDGNGRSWSSHHSVPVQGAYQTYLWRPGELVVDSHPLPVPMDLRAGSYSFQVSLFVRARGEFLSFVAQDGQVIGRSARMGSLQVLDAREGLAQAPAHPLDGISFGGQVALLGYSIEGESQSSVVERRRQGSSTLPVRLLWTAEGHVAQDYTVFVHLYDDRGALIAQHDSQPAEGTSPMRGWLPGETVEDRHVITLPPSLPAGRYRLSAGLYDLATGERLPLVTGGDEHFLSTVVQVHEK